MQPVTDPDILNQLESQEQGSMGLQPVTDPNILTQLESSSETKPGTSGVGIWEDFIKPTLKAIPAVTSATLGSLAAMPLAGIAGLSELAATGDVMKAGRTIRDVAGYPSKIFLTTPAEQQGAENIGLAMKPFEMAGEGWREIGKLTGIPYAEPVLGSMGEAAAMFTLPKLPKAIRDSNFYRGLTIPERGLVLQSLEDTMKANPEMSTGQILRTWNNPTWQAEALGSRPAGEVFDQAAPPEIKLPEGPTPPEALQGRPFGPPEALQGRPFGPPGPPPPGLVGRPGETGFPPPEISPIAGEARPPSPASSSLSTDNQTGSTFGVLPGQDIEARLMETRKKFESPKGADLQPVTDPKLLNQLEGPSAGLEGANLGHSLSDYPATIERLAADKAAVKATLVKPTEEPKTLISWIRRKGGIWDESLTGETREFLGRESGVIGLVSKNKGKTLDELAELAKDDGWLPEEAGSRDLIDLLGKDVAAAKSGAVRVKGLRTSPKEEAKLEKDFFDQWDKASLEEGGEAITKFKNLEEQASKINEIVTKKVQPELDKIVAPIVKEFAGSYKGNAKSAKSIIDKVIRKQAFGESSYSPMSIKDHARGSIILDNFKQAPDVINKFKEKGFEVEITINEPLNIFGYRGINATTKLSDGFRGEIQIHQKNSWDLKTKTDDIYRRWRDYTREDITALSQQDRNKYISDLEKSRDLWSAYWDTIPLEIKSKISESGKGLDSVTAPNFKPLGSTHPSSLETTQGTSLRSQISLPSRNLDTSGKSIMASPKNKLAQQEENIKPIYEKFRSGPGAQTAGTGVKEIPSDLAQLTQSLDHVTSPKEPLSSRFKKAIDISTKAGDAKDALGTAINRLKATGAAIYNAWRKPKEWTEFKGVLGDYLYSRQISSFENHDFAKTIIKQVPSKVKREAIINYIQAGGDQALLAERTAASVGKHKAGYEAALKLNADEVRFADNINNYFDSKLEEVKKWDMLKQGVENYVSQLYKKNDPWARVLIAEMDAGLLKQDPYFLKKRIFKDYFSAEQAGRIPENKDIGYLISSYDMAFNEAIASRSFVKSLLDAKAKDGKTPLAIVSGAGKIVEVPGGTDTAGLVIKPHTLPKDVAGIGYRNIDHPALKDWKWITSDALGDPVLFQGDLVIHPEVYRHLKNVLSKSAIRQNAVGKAVLEGVQTLKSTMLSLSGFHQTQEGLHAIFHKINPATAPKIDLTNAVQKELVRHGLMVSEYGGLEQFSEGVYTSGLVNKVPGIGPMMQKYGDYLFRDYIPRIKMKMALEALERNTARYGNKLSPDQILEITANQANAAFGELNIKMMGRHPSTQDALRLILLAPDFLEARAKFVGQGLKPFGREQSAALIRGALGMYIGARVANQIIDGDPHWDKPFSIVIKGKEFALRSVPGDIVHLITDPNSFVYYRLSPTTVKPIVEWATSRDAMGRKKSTEDQIKDFFQTHVPIPIQGMLKDSEKTIWDSMLQAIGVSSWKNRTKAEKLVSDINFEKINKGIQSPEQKEISKLRKDVFQEYDKSKKTPESLKQALKEKKVGPEEAVEWLLQARTPPLMRGFKRLTLEEAQQVWKVANPPEKRLLRETYMKTIENRLKAIGEGKTSRMPLGLRDAYQTQQEARGF